MIAHLEEERVASCKALERLREERSDLTTQACMATTFGKDLKTLYVIVQILQFKMNGFRLEKSKQGAEHQNETISQLEKRMTAIEEDKLYTLQRLEKMLQGTYCRIYEARHIYP
jgi:hypothetical protein